MFFLSAFLVWIRSVFTHGHNAWNCGGLVLSTRCLTPQTCPVALCCLVVKTKLQLGDFPIEVMDFALPLGEIESQCFSVFWKSRPRCRARSAEKSLLTACSILHVLISRSLATESSCHECLRRYLVKKKSVLWVFNLWITCGIFLFFLWCPAFFFSETSVCLALRGSCYLHVHCRLELRTLEIYM